jgi:PPM family protein phosphatase
MMARTELRCPVCQTPHQEGDRFCEHCGATLAGDDSQPLAADRTDRDLAIAAVVSDRGLVHRRNEDSFQIEVIGERGVSVVVCDGISTASAGNVAARDAASAAGGVLAEALADPAKDGGEATLEAISAANGAVEEVEWTRRTRRVVPSCTLVSAICRGNHVVIGWVGDSRAYWVDAERTLRLTVDDSMADEGIAQGLLTPEQAARSPFMHSITHWVGPNAPDRPPRLSEFRPDHPGRLVLCSDGLWNYLTGPDELRELIAALPDGSTPVAVAHALTDMAVQRGGHDNITVAVVDIEPS